MLNFDKELINVVQNDKNGSVVVTGELTIVGLPNEFFKILITIFILFFLTNSYADNHDQNLTEGVKEIVDELQEDEEVPLNDPFAGNEGTSGSLDAEYTRRRKRR